MPRYIDANALQKRLQDFSDWCRDGRKQGVDFVIDCPLPDIPTADVLEVKHGKWIYKYKGTDRDDIAYCSLCNFYSEDKINNIGQCFHYCPNCGAKMGGENESTDKPIIS